MNEMITATRVETIPPITRAEVEGLATTEYARTANQLRSLTADDWSAPTDCPRWDVRAVAGHSTGMLATFTGYRTLMRAMRRPALRAPSDRGHMWPILVADEPSLS